MDFLVTDIISQSSTPAELANTFSNQINPAQTINTSFKH